MATYCPEDLSSRELSCPICFEDYDIHEPRRYPKLLLCLHTFCTDCIRLLCHNDGTLECSICRMMHTGVRVDELFINHVIFTHLRTKFEERDLELARMLDREMRDQNEIGLDSKQSTVQTRAQTSTSTQSSVQAQANVPTQSSVQAQANVPTSKAQAQPNVSTSKAQAQAAVSTQSVVHSGSANTIASIQALADVSSMALVQPQTPATNSTRYSVPVLAWTPEVVTLNSTVEDDEQEEQEEEQEEEHEDEVGEEDNEREEEQEEEEEEEEGEDMIPQIRDDSDWSDEHSEEEEDNEEEEDMQEMSPDEFDGDAFLADLADTTDNNLENDGYEDVDAYLAELADTPEDALDNDDGNQYDDFNEADQYDDFNNEEYVHCDMDNEDGEEDIHSFLPLCNDYDGFRNDDDDLSNDGCYVVGDSYNDVVGVGDEDEDDGWHSASEQ
ncbi:hypothetical protein Pcinc_020415 [Petrolisthes cinctipes]|uniref:RING-type domain-containing protein n=1 Tax=Petrolisthes cinctipes TaxID=88211 RepID=A0AAE1FKA5_PETCI|nr:hypothetical protein Pcinc_020415 [Petrolisthes cinctipes]